MMLRTNWVSSCSVANNFTAFRMAMAVCLAATLLAGCDGKEEAPAAEIRPVRVITVEKEDGGTTVSLTGTVQAQTEVNFGFRIGGRMTERLVNIGDTVSAGQTIARLDPQNEENTLRAARADVAAAAAQAAEARNEYDRQSHLYAGGWVSRARYDRALQSRHTAESQLDSAHAQFDVAEDRVSYTELVADAEGTVTARGAEPGEIVQAGQMIVQVARQDGRDAVFDVPPQIMDQAPPNPRIEVSLSMDPAVTAIGRVREVSPRADAATGTFQVRVGLADPPEQMRLGATVTGRMRIDRDAGISVPASALTGVNEQPAVWVVDPATMTVDLRPVEIDRFDQARVILAHGVEPGELVVTAGVHALRPGQAVRLLGTGS
jgi:membrane fusion protein, multidrug efflux system